MPVELSTSKAAFRRNTIRFFVSFFSIFSIIVLLNYFIDPLWTYPHAHRFNTRQIKIEDRQQKTNLITYVHHDFDAILLGSSRTTFISYKDFKGVKLFNYALDNTLPEEYADYISYARKQSRPGVKLVVIGLDFFGTNSNFKGYGQKPPDEYFRNAEDPYYRMKSLFLFDTLRYSMKNIYKSLKKPDGFFYSRDSINHCIKPPVSKESKMKSVDYTIREFRKRMYGENYQYREMRKILKDIRQKNPDVKIVAFTTPTTEPLWKLLVEQGRLDDYCRWITDIVSEFDEVINFMGVNSITSNLDNYYDGHHFFPKIGTLIAARVMNIPDKNLPDDFGQRVNRENLDRFLVDVKQRYSSLPRKITGKGGDNAV